MRVHRDLAWLLAALLCAGAARIAHAQSVRGVVVDATDRPVAGVVLQLLDSTSRVSSRALSNERGEFSLAARIAGTYRVRSMRIGFQQSISPGYTLGAGAVRTERIRLAGIEFRLDTLRVVATNSCKLVADSGAATFAVLQQARTALLATDLTRASRNITSTTMTHERTLDAAGRRTLKQGSTLRTEYVQQPWRAIETETLHRAGYVVRDEDNSVNYYAPGIEMLTSDVFVADHCFRLTRRDSLVGLEFTPIPERRGTAEISGTIWVEQKSAALRHIEFKYVNLPSDIDAGGRGNMEFARLKNGAWAISRWDIRMPVFAQVMRAQNFGGNAIQVAEIRTQGGELVMALRGTDTLWSQPPRNLTGTVRDSVSGSAIQNATVTLAGTTLSGVSDGRGHFRVSGVLPGAYVLQVRTPALDSISAAHQWEFEFTDESRRAEVLVPTAAQLMASVCGGEKSPEAGVLVGQVTMRGGAPPPADTRVMVDWTGSGMRSIGGAVAATRPRDYREVRTDASGAFRLCGVPVETKLTIEARSDSAVAETTSIQIPANGRFARATLSLERSGDAVAMLVGSVLQDSTRAPILDAEVTLPGLARAVQTDERGNFRLAGIPTGTHRLVVRRIGYGALDTSVVFTAGQVVRRTVILGRVTQLAEMNTTVSMVLPSFEEHKKIGLGKFLTRTELARMEGRTMATVLSEFRGAQILRAGGKMFLGSSRRHTCVPGLPCPPDYFDLNCYAKVFLDGMLMNRGRPTPPFELSQTIIESLEAVEHYAGASETPMKYMDHNTNCGVLVLWTRHSR